MQHAQPSPPPPSIDTLLDASRADPAFKADVRAYLAHAFAARLVVAGHAPRAKVVRVLAQLLAAEPALAIESVRLRGFSGCSDFQGEVTATVAETARTWDFLWDCRWRARDAGLVDLLGFPDQARAAREYDWQCFARWAERPPAERSHEGSHATA